MSFRGNSPGNTGFAKLQIFPQSDVIVFHFVGDQDLGTVDVRNERIAKV